MCIFLSWLHYDGEDLFIDDDTLMDEKGKELVKHLDAYYWEDIVGHGALMHLHKFNGAYTGDHIEQTDFSDLANFPKAIIESINKCKFRNVGMPEYVRDFFVPDVASAFENKKATEMADFHAEHKTINNVNNWAIEDLRKASRLCDSNANEVYKVAEHKAYVIREAKLKEPTANYQDFTEKYYATISIAAEFRELAKSEGNPKDEIDVLFKKNTRETKELHHAYKKKLVNRFWDLFEDHNNRTERWRNIS